MLPLLVTASGNLDSTGRNFHPWHRVHSLDVHATADFPRFSAVPVQPARNQKGCDVRTKPTPVRLVSIGVKIHWIAVAVGGRAEHSHLVRSCWRLTSQVLVPKLCLAGGCPAADSCRHTLPVWPLMTSARPVSLAGLCRVKNSNREIALTVSRGQMFQCSTDRQKNHGSAQ